MVKFIYNQPSNHSINKCLIFAHYVSKIVLNTEYKVLCEMDKTLDSAELTV